MLDYHQHQKQEVLAVPLQILKDYPGEVDEELVYEVGVDLAGVGTG